MVNSRQLAEGVAIALGKPQTSTAQHVKNLREAKGAKEGLPLVTAGGRGRNAPAMSRRDAATLVCAVLGAEAVKDSVTTVEWMRDLKPEFHGYRFKGLFRQRGPDFDFTAGIRPEHNVIEALECVLGFFDREEDYLSNLEHYGRWRADIYVRFYVEFPQRFVSLTFGVRRMVSAFWTYGRRSGGPDKQARWADQHDLRAISEISRSPQRKQAESE
ncbi:hypothetical protein [Bradyrhizobium sp. RDT46]|uniref:hypothetical protein n=1 Tax=Bradyrhizobium sp. RDT46 TaxID=3341829 RepID=UPI0035C6ABAD